MMCGIAERGRSLLLQDFLDGFGCLAFGEASAVGYAEHMRVDGEGFGAKCDVKHHVRSFAPDAREQLEQVAVGRDFAAILIDK